MDILFVGTNIGFEATVVPQQGYNFKTIRVKGLKREFSFAALKAMGQAFSAVLESKEILREFKPDVVVGLGGYVSSGPVSAALFLGIPTIIHEQNVTPGLANRLLGKFVDVIAISYLESQKKFSTRQEKIHFVGNPVRREILETTRPDAINFFGLEPSKKTFFIFGGSRGSQNINMAMVEAYPLFSKLKDLQIIHATGKLEFTEISKAINSLKKTDDKITYRCHPYVDAIGVAYAAADLVVCRAGATTIAEITSRGLPAILIPYPYASGNHQQKNAHFLAENGAAELILDRDLNGETLFERVKGLLDSPSRLAEMKNKCQQLGKPKAAEELAKLVVEVAGKKFVGRRNR